MTVLVSMPYWNNAQWVEAAVRSVLAQTHRDLVCVVIGDGEEPPLKIADSRLVVYTLPENHGAYFAQSVALGASPHPWYAPHAADDWSEPDHIERLMAYGTDTAAGAVWEHRGRSVRLVRKRYEVGLFRTERLLALGGYNPAERLGQDSLMLRLLRVTGPLEASDHPTYHRIHRKGSLCNHRDTKKGSPAREAMKVRNRAVAVKCERLRVNQVAAYRESIIPAAIRAERDRHISALSELLS